MAESASGQDIANPVFLLATQAILALSGSRKKNVLVLAMINPLLTKLVQSRYLDIGLVLFCVFIDLDFFSVHKKRKKMANIQPS